MNTLTKSLLLAVASLAVVAAVISPNPQVLTANIPAQSYAIDAITVPSKDLFVTIVKSYTTNIVRMWGYSAPTQSILFNVSVPLTSGPNSYSVSTANEADNEIIVCLVNPPTGFNCTSFLIDTHHWTSWWQSGNGMLIASSLQTPGSVVIAEAQDAAGGAPATLQLLRMDTHTKQVTPMCAPYTALAGVNSVRLYFYTAFYGFALLPLLSTTGIVGAVRLDVKTGTATPVDFSWLPRGWDLDPIAVDSADHSFAVESSAQMWEANVAPVFVPVDLATLAPVPNAANYTSLVLRSPHMNRVVRGKCVYEIGVPADPTNTAPALVTQLLLGETIKQLDVQAVTVPGRYSAAGLLVSENYLMNLGIDSFSNSLLWKVSCN